nr:transcriptional repressor [uncultured Dethiosulfovibrio sp.]
MVIQRRSKQRDAVLAVVSQEGFHPTAEDVLFKVREEMPKVSLGTIYRNLDQLCESGAIWKLPVSDGPCRYEGNPERHLHSMCPICGAVKDVWPSGDPIDRSSLPEEYGEADYRLLLISPCDKCKDGGEP